MAVTGLVVPYELETEAQVAFEDHRGYESGFRRTWTRVDPAARGSAAAAHGAVGSFGAGANMAYRKHVFADIGGCDPALGVGTATQGGGGLEMFFRVLKEGHLLVRHPRAVVFHRHRRTREELRAQISTWGIGMYSYIVRSWRAYLDERPGFPWLATRWLVLRNAGRFLRSLRQPRRRQLVWDERKRSLLAPGRYRQAARRAGQIRAEFGEEPFGERPRAPFAPAAAARQVHTGRRAVLRIDLAAPLAPLHAATGASRTAVKVRWREAELGTVRVANRGQAISPPRLRDGVADHLAGSILARVGIAADELLAGLLPDARPEPHG